MILTNPPRVLTIDDHHLTIHEIATIESDDAAMRARVDGDRQLFPTAKYLRMYSEHKFCGAVAMLNLLPNPLQVEFHLFYLSTAPKMVVRQLIELCYIYAVVNRLQPYTRVRNVPELQYMINFMRRMGAVELEHEDHLFFTPPVNWRPRFTSQVTINF